MERFPIERKNPIMNYRLSNYIKTCDPYQLLFPLGILSGMFGVSFWILFWIGIYPGYPNFAHSETMMGGFLFVTATGFLMTALPKFSGTASASPAEKSAVLLLSLGLLAVSPFQSRLAFHAVFITLILFLLRFAWIRFRKASLRPPASFVFVAAGLFSAIAGSALLLVRHFTELQAATVFMGRTLFLYGPFLGFIIGIGTKLIPSILGLIPMQPGQPTPLSLTPREWTQLRFFIPGAALFLASFWIECQIDRQAGQGVRALVLSWIIFTRWKIYRLPATKGILALCLYVSSWALVIGLWAGVLFPNYAIHGAHVLFIGSVSLMIFSIATRVSLAHGGHGLGLEKNSKALWAVLILLLLALASRLAAPFTPGYALHLAVASSLWIAAALCWLAVFLKKIWSRKGNNSDSCSSRA